MGLEKDPADMLMILSACAAYTVGLGPQGLDDRASVAKRIEAILDASLRQVRWKRNLKGCLFHHAV